MSFQLNIQITLSLLFGLLGKIQTILLWIQIDLFI